MKVVHCEQIEAVPVPVEGAANCRMRCLIGPDDAAPSFSMRLFEVAPGGHTAKHVHAHEHEVFVLEGQGVALEGDREHPLGPGSVVYVAAERPAPIPQHGRRPAEVSVLDSASLARSPPGLRGRLRMRRVSWGTRGDEA